MEKITADEAAQLSSPAKSTASTKRGGVSGLDLVAYVRGKPRRYRSQRLQQWHEAHG